MLFKNRKEAGQELAKALLKYRKAPETLVLGLPRGGVVIAYEVAKILQLPLDIIIPRKIGAPFNPELAIGAIVGEEMLLDQELISLLDVSQTYLDQEVAKEKGEAARRLALYRKGKSSQDFKGKAVLLVDDGIATGSTIRASLRALKKMGVKKIVIAVPVGPPDTIEALRRESDEVIALYAPASFAAVGQFYDSFPQTTDQEVIDLLGKSL